MSNDKKLGGIFKDFTVSFLDGTKRVYGQIYGDVRWEDGEMITTSKIVAIDPITKTIETENTIYRYEEQDESAD